MSAPPKFDAIVIGGGGDGLVAATLLSKAGLSVQHLAAEDTVAGLSQPVEFAPGYHARLGLEADWIPDAVIRVLGLPPELDPPRIPASVSLPNGGLLPLSRHVGDAAAAIRTHSPRDAERWADFTGTMHELAGFLEALYQTPATDLDTTAIGDIPSVLALGRSFRSLGKANMSELLRVMPMAVQDLADEWFTFEPLKAAIGSAAVRDIQQGPRSGGTTFVLLHYLTGVPNGSLRGRPWLPPTDGSDTVIALAEQAARQHKVAIRTGAEVERIRVRDDATTGVVLVGGEEIAAPMVLSTLDPARTLLRLVDPVWLDPEFLLAVKNIKFRGATAMIYYGLDALPFEHGSGVERSLTGVVSLSNSLDAIEKAYDAAKYGGVSEHPHVEITMPSLLRPRDGGRHVLVAKAQYVPHTLRDNAPWDAAKSSALGDAVTAAISRLIPRFNNVVVERVVLTPRDLEQTFGLTGGAVTMGEMTLDQILFMRPVAGWGQYATPITGLYLGGPGTHPGPGVFGASGLLAAKRMLADSRKRK